MAIEKRHPTITGGTIAGGALTWNLPANMYPDLAKVTDATYEQLSREKQAAEAQHLKQKWLEETQSMRVVALNEACGIAKALGGNVNASDVTRMAGVFAEFLIEARA